MLVKVNSVLIPGINDRAIDDVSWTLRQYGAFIHNIMPLISRPEHGTVFGLNERRAGCRAGRHPSTFAVSEMMPQMTHCQQCRADAIGMLGEDRSPQFQLRPIPTEPHAVADPAKAGKCITSIATQGESDEPEACLVAVASTPWRGDRLSFWSRRSFSDLQFVCRRCGTGQRAIHPWKYCQGSDDCEPQDSETRMVAMLDLLADVKAVFCSRIGYGPWQRLEAQGIQPCVDDAWQPVSDALARWWETWRGACQTK